MLKAALSGNYVNFGVFRLYGDDALDSALNIFIKLLLSIPQNDLLVSSKGVVLVPREISSLMYCEINNCFVSSFEAISRLFTTLFHHNLSLVSMMDVIYKQLIL